MKLTPEHFPYHNARHYWLCVWCEDSAPAAFAKALLAILGMVQEKPAQFYLPTGQQWGASWLPLKQVLRHYAPPAGVHLAIVSGIDKPSAAQLPAAEKSLAALDALAQSLWLGEAILANGLELEWQGIFDRKGHALGYEAFARLRRADSNTLADGTDIFHAARGLQIEALLDSAFHTLALQQAPQSGKIFLNQLPGFTQRPESALPRLLKLLHENHFPPERLVLDIAPAGLEFDPHSLRKTIALCHAEGIACALDDIRSPRSLQTAIAQTQPDFVKLGMGLVHFCEHPAKKAEIAAILAAAGTLPLIAKGVETERQHQHLAALGIPYFQGRLL